MPRARRTTTPVPIDPNRPVWVVSEYYGGMTYFTDEDRFNDHISYILDDEREESTQVIKIQSGVITDLRVKRSNAFTLEPR